MIRRNRIGTRREKKLKETGKQSLQQIENMKKVTAVIRRAEGTGKESKVQETLQEVIKHLELQNNQVEELAGEQKAQKRKHSLGRDLELTALGSILGEVKLNARETTKAMW